MNGKPRFGFVVEYVKDIEAAKAFYVDVLGLEMQRYHPTFVQFENFAIASDQPIGATGEPELYWLVDDAEAAYSELSQKAEVHAPLAEAVRQVVRDQRCRWPAALSARAFP